MIGIDQIHQKLQPLIKAIQYHPLYAEIKSIADLRIFMEHHVFAVWDFMCLLKELHSRLVTTRAPWFPSSDSFSAHLIGKILIEEESDRTADNSGYCSHFELYLTAMRAIGANTQRIETFLARLRLAEKDILITAAESSQLPTSIQQFILTTFSFFSRETHILASAFVYGREAVTTVFFPPLVEQIKNTIPDESQFSLAPLLYYLNRHIQLDSENHFPNALQILKNLAANDQKKWRDIGVYAQLALQARLDFLTIIQMKIRASQQTQIMLATSSN